MDRYSIKILISAHRDIDEIRNGIIAEYESYEDADVVERYIYETINSLHYAPKGHHLFRGNDRLDEAVWKATARKKYGIYYLVHDDAKEVIVLRVIHTKRDVRRVWF